MPAVAGRSAQACQLGHIFMIDDVRFTIYELLLDTMLCVLTFLILNNGVLF